MEEAKLRDFDQVLRARISGEVSFDLGRKHTRLYLLKKLHPSK